MIKRTYRVQETSLSDLQRWLKAPSADCSKADFPVFLGLALRKLEAWDVADKMSVWFSDASTEWLSTYLIIVLEELQRPDWMESYAEVKSGGWIPIQPESEAFSLTEARLILGLSYAAIVAKAADHSPDTLVQKSLCEKAEKAASFSLSEAEKAFETLTTELKEWSYNSAQLIPNAEQAHRWVKIRIRELAAPASPATEQPPLASAPPVAEVAPEAAGLPYRQVALLRFYRGEHVTENNAQAVAEQFGLRSGTVLFDKHWKKICSDEHMNAIHSKRVADDLIRKIESIYIHLNEAQRKRAESHATTINKKKGN